MAFFGGLVKGLRYIVPVATTIGNIAKVLPFTKGTLGQRIASTVGNVFG